MNKNNVIFHVPVYIDIIFLRFSLIGESIDARAGVYNSKNNFQELFLSFSLF